MKHTLPFIGMLMLANTTFADTSYFGVEGGSTTVHFDPHSVGVINALDVLGLDPNIKTNFTSDVNSINYFWDFGEKQQWVFEFGVHNLGMYTARINVDQKRKMSYVQPYIADIPLAAATYNGDVHLLSSGIMKATALGASASILYMNNSLFDSKNWTVNTRLGILAVRLTLEGDYKYNISGQYTIDDQIGTVTEPYQYSGAERSRDIQYVFAPLTGLSMSYFDDSGYVYTLSTKVVGLVATTAYVTEVSVQISKEFNW